jgi:hypothetical protein
LGLPPRVDSTGKAGRDIPVYGSYYVVGGAKESCDFMRRWSRSLIKRNGGASLLGLRRRARSGGCTRRTGHVSSLSSSIARPTDLTVA